MSPTLPKNEQTATPTSKNIASFGFTAEWQFALQSSTTGLVVQYSRPKVGGIQFGRPWTGGHRDPVKIEPEPMSPYCWRTQEIEQKTFKRVEEGVEK